MKLRMILTAAVAAVIAGSTVAQADTAFNQQVVPVGSDLYFGSGNPNGDFAVTTGGNVTLGLRADYAFGSLIAGTQSDGTGSGEYYTVPAGTVYDSETHSQIAKWDFVFSIDTGSTPLATTGATANLTVSGPGGTLSFNPLGIPDNYINGATLAISTVAQNAENITFGATPGNPNVLGTYEFDLSIENSTGQTVTDTMFVNVVPVPASAWSGLALLGGLGLFGAVKRNRKQMA